MKSNCYSNYGWMMNGSNSNANCYYGSMIPNYYWSCDLTNYEKNLNESLSCENWMSRYPRNCCCYEKMIPNCWNSNGYSNCGSKSCVTSLNDWNSLSWNSNYGCYLNDSMNCDLNCCGWNLPSYYYSNVKNSNDSKNYDWTSYGCWKLSCYLSYENCSNVTRSCGSNSNVNLIPNCWSLSGSTSCGSMMNGCWNYANSKPNCWMSYVTTTQNCLSLSAMS